MGNNVHIWLSDRSGVDSLGAMVSIDGNSGSSVSCIDAPHLNAIQLELVGNP